MENEYKIYGVEPSPYSIKVRSYFRYKKIPHQWIVRNMDHMADFQKLAKIPLIPLVQKPDGSAIQDSTPIIEKTEQDFPDNSIYTGEATLDFIGALIEEFADEWCNKPMFHYRWWYEADQYFAGRWIAQSTLPAGADDKQVDDFTYAIIDRMVPRITLVGSCDKTKDLIENSYKNMVDILDKHLSEREFLLGGRPSFADFALYAEFFELMSDPVPGEYLKMHGPHICEWVQRMLDPSALGEFEAWETLAPTLMPLLRTEIGGNFLPWSTANAAAIEAGEQSFSVQLAGGEFAQEPQKYHARSLAEIRRKYHQAANAELDDILQQAGCLQHLQ